MDKSNTYQESDNQFHFGLRVKNCIQMLIYTGYLWKNYGSRTLKTINISVKDDLSA
jgi:hypothetical protein